MGIKESLTVKILYHHRTRAVGAEGVHIYGIARALQDMGHEVYIVSPRGIVPASHDRNATSNSSGRMRVFQWISRHAPELLFEICELGYNVFGMAHIHRSLRKRHFDLIYERYAFFTWCGAFLAKRWGLPYIVEVNEVAGVKRVRGQVLLRLSRRIEKKIFETADAIIVVSEFLKDTIVRRGVDPRKIHVQPNAADAQVFHPRLDGRIMRQRFDLEGRTTIGFIGSLLPWHNLDLLFESIREIYDQDEYAVCLFLVGEGSFRSELERSVADKGLEEHVVFAGAADYENMPELISAMDICVVPHSNEFRSPIKLFEYMAMGKPVVAPDTPPISQVIAHGENGLLFKAGDKGSLKQVLLCLLESEQKRAELGQKARETVCEAHTWEHNARRIVSICQSL